MFASELVQAMHRIAFSASALSAALHKYGLSCYIITHKNPLSVSLYTRTYSPLARSRPLCISMDLAVTHTKLIDHSHIMGLCRLRTRLLVHGLSTPTRTYSPLARSRPLSTRICCCVCACASAFSQGITLSERTLRRF